MYLSVKLLYKLKLKEQIILILLLMSIHKIKHNYFKRKFFKLKRYKEEH